MSSFNFNNRDFHAVIRPKSIFREGELFNLSPKRGNVHCFYAKEDSVIIDVLTPYYSSERICNFYEITQNQPKEELQNCVHCKMILKNIDRLDNYQEITEVKIMNGPPSCLFNEISYCCHREENSQSQNFGIDGILRSNEDGVHHLDDH